MPDLNPEHVMAYGPVQHHRELIVWQRAMELLRESYGIARRLPREELFALSSQLRRAAVSVPSNIAEGHARVHRKEFVHHLSIARGSLAEVETLLDACEQLGLIPSPGLLRARDQADQIRRMLASMMSRLRRQEP